MRPLRGTMLNLGGTRIGLSANFLAAWLVERAVRKGISTAERERIFERFYRVGSELTRESHGIGIGLSIVNHIAKAHGGAVSVESNPEQGTTFCLRLLGKESPTMKESGT